MASGLTSDLGASGVVAGAAGVEVAAGSIGVGAGVSVAQEAIPADRESPAIIRRALKFILF